MKRWILLTLLLYMLSISVLTVPLFMALFENGLDMVAIFYVWFVPVLLLVQWVILLVPMDIARERPVRKRKVVVSAVIGALPVAVLALGFSGAVVLMIWGETEPEQFLYRWPALIIPAIFWLVAGFIFYRNFSNEDPNRFSSTITRWLLRGSILELIVAVPSHIISRQREECCAPPLTLLGIATGLAIALMSFGPGLFFLFARRIRQKQGRSDGDGPNSDS